MTGRDLIMYILMNGLEDEPIIRNGKFIGLLSANEVAGKMGTGVETVRAWVSLGIMDGVHVSEGDYIFANYRSPYEFKVLNKPKKGE